MCRVFVCFHQIWGGIPNSVILTRPSYHSPRWLCCQLAIGKRPPPLEFQIDLETIPIALGYFVYRCISDFSMVKLVKHAIACLNPSLGQSKLENPNSRWVCFPTSLTAWRGVSDCTRTVERIWTCWDSTVQSTQNQIWWKIGIFRDQTKFNIDLIWLDWCLKKWWTHHSQVREIYDDLVKEIHPQLCKDFQNQLQAQSSSNEVPMWGLWKAFWLPL